MSLPGLFLPARSGLPARATGAPTSRRTRCARRGLSWITVLVLALVFALPARAIDVSSVSLDPTDEFYVVNADFNVDLPPPIEEALDNGVALYFVVEFELVRPRWYWFDERTVASRLQYRLTYHSLSRQYRLSTGNLQQPFQTLGEALRVLGHVQAWPVLERDQVSPERTYQAAVRLRLDTTQLPKPFQLTAITNREWNLASDWKRFNFTPAPAPVVTRSIEHRDAKSGDAKPGDVKGSDTKAGDTKGSGDSRPAEGRGLELKPIDPRPSDARSDLRLNEGTR